MHRRRLAWSALLALAGCAVPPGDDAARDDDEGDRVWPAPPEPARFVFETDLRGTADLFEDDPAQRLQRLATGVRAPTERVFDKPVAVAARRGRIYVADSAQRRVVVFDVPRRKLFALGLRAPGTLAKPVALAVDASGRLHVADAERRQLLVYDALGLHLRTLGGPADLVRPTGVAVNVAGTEVAVVDRADNDSDRHRVLLFDAHGQRLRELGRRGGGPGEFNVPVQAAYAPDGTLWVLDAGNFRVQAFDGEGRFLRSFGQAGTGLGQFARPRGLACDDAGRLYVSDAAFGNVQVFAPDGALLIALGRGARRDRPGRYGLAAGVAVDETGRLYVVDQVFNKVEVLRRLDAAA